MRPIQNNVKDVIHKTPRGCALVGIIRNAQAPKMASSAPVSLCEIIATVPTGLEHGAADECREILGREAKIQRGRILIELLSVEELTKVSNSS